MATGTNPTWTPERIADVTAAVQAALSEAQGHEADAPGAAEGGELFLDIRVCDDYDDNAVLDSEPIPGAEPLEILPHGVGISFEVCDFYIFARNVALPQYIARLQQDLAALHRLAKIEAKHAPYDEANQRCWEMAGGAGRIPIDDERHFMWELAEQIAANIGCALGIGGSEVEFMDSVRNL